MFTPTIRSVIGPGCAIVVATVGSDDWPRATRGWSIEIVERPDPTIRVVVGADDEVLVQQLATSTVAVTGSDVETLESVQMKGPVIRIEQPDADDLAAFAEGCEVFLEKIRRTDGNPVHQMRRIIAQRLLAIEVEVTQLFDQTPGPAAGRVLTADGTSGA